MHNGMPGRPSRAGDTPVHPSASTTNPMQSTANDKLSGAGARDKAGRPAPLRQWLWRSYLKTTLYPLLLVEVVLVAIYLWTSSAAYRENTAALRHISTEELSGIARREARHISERLAGIGRTTRLFGQQVGAFLADVPLATEAMHAEIAEGPDGMRYTRRDRGRGAVYFSGLVPADEAARNRVAASELLGPLMRDIKESDELIVQLYFTTADSMNRLYPWYDVPATFPPGLDVTQENFYYLADATHNPERRVRWTDASLDPAGAGWIVSSIAPVYDEGVLEATVGIDITLNTIIDEVVKLDIPWQGYGVLVDQQGNVIALPPDGEHDFDLPELAAVDYQTAIRDGVLEPDDFNILRRPALASLGALVGASAAGVGDSELRGQRMVGWSSVPETGWKLLVIVRSAEIFADANRWRAEVTRIAAWMVGGMVGFYALFFAFLYLRARRKPPPLLAADATERRDAGDRVGRLPAHRRAFAHHRTGRNRRAARRDRRADGAQGRGPARVRGRAARRAQ